MENFKESFEKLLENIHSYFYIKWIWKFHFHLHYQYTGSKNFFIPITHLKAFSLKPNKKVTLSYNVLMTILLLLTYFFTGNCTFVWQVLPICLCFAFCTVGVAHVITFFLRILKKEFIASYWCWRLKQVLVLTGGAFLSFVKLCLLTLFTANRVFLTNPYLRSDLFLNSKRGYFWHQYTKVKFICLFTLTWEFFDFL